MSKEKKDNKDNDYLISDSEEENDNEIEQDSEEQEKDTKFLAKKTKRNQTKNDEEESMDGDDMEEENEEESEEDEKDKDNEEENKDNNKQSYTSETWNELFIKNLSYNTNQKKLKEYFSKFGEVEDVKIVLDKKTNKSKGVGFCRFKDPKSAAAAIKQKNKLNLDGRQLTISYSNEKHENKKENSSAPVQARNNKNNNKFSIFVANLNFKSTEEGIKNFFKGCGKILDVRIAKNQNGKVKGFAHVDFDSKKSVELAMKKNNCRLDKRRLRIEIAGETPKKKNKKETTD